MKIINIIWKWMNATRLRKLLSSTLAVLILLTSIRFLLLKPKEVQAADVYLGFDEGYGTTSAVNDKDGTIPAGSITGAVWKSEEFCKVGKCLYFDGADDYVQFADNNNLDFAATDDFSVEAWFRHQTTMNASDQIVSKREDTGTDGGYDIKLNNSGQVVCQIEDDDADTNQDGQVVSPLSYNDNQWHQFACVYDGQVSLTLYVDGNQVDQTTSVSSNTTLANDDPLFVGVFDTAHSVDYEGFIDEVKVYRSARTATEIKADYTGETPSRGSSASFGPDSSYLSNGLVGYWKMDENTGTTVTDFSGNGNTMTFGNSPSWGTGNFGSGVTMNGTNSYLTSTSVKDSLKIRTHGLSAFMWEKVTKSVSTDRILLYDGAGNSTDAGFILQPDHTTGVMQFWISDGSSYIVNNLTGTSDILDGNWHFVGFTWNPQDGAKLYADGKLEASVSINTNSDINSTNATFIGGFNTSGFTSNGTVDETRFYNRALSPAEVSKLYSWAPGPVGYWKMDENTGSSLNDSTGYVGTSISMSGATTWVPGKFGSALSFDGDDYGDTPSDSDLQITGNLSLSVWSKISPSISSQDNLFSYRGTGATSTDNTLYILRVITTSGNDIQYEHQFGTQSAETNTFDTNLNTDTWYHLEIVRDTSANTVKLYVNGVQAGTTFNYTNDPTDGSTSKFRVGNSSSGGSRSFNGSLDDIKIYNYARTPSQVIEDMNAGHQAPGSPVGSAIGWWKFDEGTDNTCSGGTNDTCNSGSSGTTLDGAETGMAIPATSTSGWTNNGKFGKALSFDGSNDYVQVTDNSTLDITGDFTLSAWVARTGGTNGYVISKTNDSADGGYALLHGNSGEVYCRTNNGTSSTDSYTATGLVNADSVWHHIVAVRNGTSCRVWVDGKDRTNTVGTHTTLTANANNLRIGTQPNGTGNYFNGNIDEVEIFNSALTSDQILALYNHGSEVVMGATSTDSSGNATWSSQRENCPPGNTDGNCGSGDPSPIGEWKMDENSGTTSSYDSSGNGNTCTLTSFTSDMWVPGKLGSAINFDGNVPGDSRLNCGSATGLDDIPTTGAFSISAWIYPRSIGEGSSGRIASKDDTGPLNGWQFDINSSSQLELAADFNGATDLSARTSATLTFNQWQHVAVTWTGGVLRSNVKLYINGVEQTQSGGTDGAGTYVTDNLKNFMIGNGQTGTRTWDGYIDNVKFYNYIRTDDQIEWEYNHGAPVGWYKFDECTGTTASNSAPAANGRSAGMDATIVIGGTGTQTSTGNCTTVNTATSWYNGRIGKFNSGFSTDNSNDYAYVADTNAIDFNSEMTVSGWVNTATLPTTAVKNIEIVNKYLTSTNQREYRLFVDNTDNKYYFYVDGDGASGSTCIASSDITITTGTWHNVVGTFKSSTCKIYVDGMLQSGSATVGYSAIFNGTADAVIGMDANKTSAPDAAIYDDIRLYKYALSAKQVQLLYNEGAAVRFGP